MYLLKNLLILIVILQINQFSLTDCSENGFFSGLGNLIPKFGSSEPKKEESSWSLKNLMGEKKEEKKDSSWIPGFLKKSDPPKEDPKKEVWFPKVLGLISSKEMNLNELPPNDLSSKDASKNNLSYSSNNWKSMPNLNFSYFNISNSELFKSNYTISLLNFNISKFELFKSNYTSYFFNSSGDWFISSKVKYYGNLLGNRTFFTNNSSSNFTPSSNQTSNNSPIDYRINLNKFRDRLIRVYDNLIFCEHPCNGGQTVKKNNPQIKINGCGPSYFTNKQLKLIPYGQYFKECCVLHDMQYAECGFKKQEADHHFLYCMLDLIDQTSLNDKYTFPKIQKTFGYALFGMVDIFGCKSYSISQMQVCDCN